MERPAQFKIQWKLRDYPLPPVAAVARGQASLRLAHRLLQLDDESLSQLEGVAGSQLIVVRCASERLPWIDGVQYLGVDHRSQSLLLPTNYQPTLPPALLASAFAAKIGIPGLIAVLPDPLLLVPMRSARPLSRRTLSLWLEQFPLENQ